ncbi:MAG: leucine-rich repeat domain-containing protein [Planctomycetaceae bacterium]
MQSQRRWFQFSLRSLLVVMLLLPMVLGVYARYRAESQRQWRLVNELKAAGGLFDLVIADQMEPEIEQGAFLQWQKWLGIDLPTGLKSFTIFKSVEPGTPIANLGEFPQLESVALCDGTVKDEDLAILAKLPRLRFLRVDSDHITDQGIAALEGCTNLHDVVIEGNQLTGKGLAVVVKLPNLKGLHWDSELTTDGDLECLRDNLKLEELHLRGNTLHDAGLEAVSTCTNLERLTFMYGEFSGPAIRSLEQLQKLKYLKLFEVSFPRESVASLAKLPKLESVYLSVPLLPEDLALLGSMTTLKSLTLSGTKLTGEGLKHLTQLKELEHLEANMTLVRDEDLACFRELPRLRYLNLSNSQVTAEGVAKFRAERAEVTVEWP